MPRSSALDRADPAATPLWFTASLRVAGARGDSPEALDRLLARGDSMHPGYPAIYWARGAFLLPPWSEGTQSFERFATEHASHGPGGASIGYAMLYVAVARETCGDFLESTQVSWPKMRAGLEELAARHPSDWNWNLLGTFACRFRDVDATRAALARLGTRARLDIWSSGQSTQSCRLMATDPARRRVSMLVRLAPNVHYPPHTHAGDEELHLLNGELWIDDRKLHPGDYNYAPPGTGDRRVWSATGCSCVLVTSTEDVLT